MVGISPQKGKGYENLMKFGPWSACSTWCCTFSTLMKSHVSLSKGLKTRAIIYPLHIHRRVQICVDTVHGDLFAVAHILHPVGAIDCTTHGRVFDVFSLVPINLLLGDDTVWVTFSNYVKDSSAVEH